MIHPYTMKILEKEKCTEQKLKSSKNVHLQQYVNDGHYKSSTINQPEDTRWRTPTETMA
jgi:hypothetical protein